jgi:GNAT superfamily N-acetyltransferase
MKIKISNTRDITVDAIVELYSANKWSSAKKPEQLYNALIHSHSLVSAWIDGVLVGIGNAISDGYLTVYYPHLLVHPQHQGKGIGQQIMSQLQDNYKSFHMQMLTADAEAIHFYKKMGFETAGNTQPMWIYSGNEH